MKRLRHDLKVCLMSQLRYVFLIFAWNANERHPPKIKLNTAVVFLKKSNTSLVLFLEKTCGNLKLFQFRNICLEQYEIAGNLVSYMPLNILLEYLKS